MDAKPVILALAAIALVSAASCTTLPALGTGCGNKAIDDGEDCDGNYEASASTCIEPGQPSQCHWSCDSTACPSSFTCGTDHVCRRPAGTFTQSTAVNGESSRRVLLGDFDGDGAEDVVAVGETSHVHFFNGHVSTQQALLSSAPALPALGYVTTDGLASGIVTSSYTVLQPDKTLLVQGNIRVWRGSADRTLLPTVYPNIDLTTDGVTAGRAVSVLRTGTQGSDIFAVLKLPSGTFLTAVAGDFTAPMPPLVSGPLGSGVEKIHGRIPVGTIGGGCVNPALAPFAACEAMVLAFDGDKSVSVYSSCNATFGINDITAPGYTAPLTFALPGGDSVGGPAFLVTPPNTPLSSLIVVGNAAVYMFPGDPCSFGTGAAMSGVPITKPILAMGYLTSSTATDWVDSDGIHVPGSPFQTSAPTGTVWTDAAIGDFNLNGLPDVVAIGMSSLDFYNGTGSPLLNAKHITLDGTATHLSVGDFDGDFVSDFAISLHADSTGLATDSIDIAFGAFTGFPSEPSSVGRLASIAQLESSYFDYRLAGTSDVINTLFAMGTADSGDLVVSILQGTPDRLINSPYFLFNQDAPNTSLVSTTVADFAGLGHAGMAGMAVNAGAASLWFTPMTGDAQVDVAHVSISSVPAPAALDASGAYDRAGLAAIDVGGEPGAELVVVQPSAFFMTHVNSWKAVAYEPLTNVQMLVDKGIAARVADVDDDGDADMIVEYLDGATSTFAAKVLVNDMNGTLSFNSASALPLPPETMAVTTIHASKDGKTQLLALARTGAYIAPYSGGTVAWPKLPSVPFFLANPNVSVHDLAAGDVDGDGIDDIVIATANGLLVYFGDKASSP